MTIETRERGDSPTLVGGTRPTSLLSILPRRGASRGEYSRVPILSPLTVFATSHDGFKPFTGPTKWKRLLQVALGLVLMLFTVAGYRSYCGEDSFVEVVFSVDAPEGASEMWGRHEVMGWREDEFAGLRDLGQAAESKYRLGIERGVAGAVQYFSKLERFVETLPPTDEDLPNSLVQLLMSSLCDHQPPGLDLIKSPSGRSIPKPPAMIAYKHIHQTDKSSNGIRMETKRWVQLNKVDGWRLNFLDDEDADEWVKETFEGSEVEWAWDFMDRGVLKADLLRYLLPLVEGGVYSDVDTLPIRSIEQWGKIDVEYLNLSSTDGPSWFLQICRDPSVIVAIDVAVHQRPDWADGWPRPLGICQWTLSSAPHHPIFVDAARRVVESTNVVADWEEEREMEVMRLQGERPEGWEQDLLGLLQESVVDVMPVMEWTGPGLFTDSVLAYLLARYDVTWHRLRDLKRPLRIGEVLILPITAFSPGGEPDFHAEGPSSPQAAVVHEFRGSWRADGMR